MILVKMNQFDKMISYSSPHYKIRFFFFRQWPSVPEFVSNNCRTFRIASHTSLLVHLRPSLSSEEISFYSKLRISTRHELNRRNHVCITNEDHVNIQNRWHIWLLRPKIRPFTHFKYILALFDRRMTSCHFFVNN